MAKRPVTTLLIGLGGSGAWTLVHVKRQLYDAYDNQIPDNVALAVLDTAKTVIVGVGPENLVRQPGMGIGRTTLDATEISHVGGDAYELVREIDQTENYPHIKSWFLSELFLSTLPRATFQLDQGAGQFRQFGRLALFRDVMQPGTSVVAAIIDNKLRDLAKKRQPNDPAIAVMIVGSLAGGTGAGLFLDIPHLVQKVAEINNIPISLKGFFYLPQAFRGTLNPQELEPARARAFAAMRELKRFLLNSDYKYGYPMHYHRARQGVNADLWRSENVGKLYDFVYLFDGEGESRMNTRKLELGAAPVVADAITSFIDENFGPAKAQYEINTRGKIQDKQGEVGRKAFISTLGAYSIIMPIQQIIEGWAYRLSLETVRKIVPAEATNDRGYITALSSAGNPEQTSLSSRDELQRLAKSLSPVSDPLDPEGRRQLFPLPLWGKVYDIHSSPDPEAVVLKRLSSYDLRDWLEFLVPPQQQSDDQTRAVLTAAAKVLQEDITDHVDTSDEKEGGDPSRDWQEIQTRANRFINLQLGMPASGGGRQGGQYREALSRLTQLQTQRFREYMTAYVYRELNGEARRDVVAGKTGKLGWLIAVFNELRAMLASVNQHLDKLRGSGSGINNRRAETEEMLESGLRNMQAEKDTRGLLGNRRTAINAQKAYISAVSDYIDYYRMEFARDEVSFTLQKLVAFCDQLLAELGLWARILATNTDSLHNELLDGQRTVASDRSRAEEVMNHRVINDSRWEDARYEQYVSEKVVEDRFRAWRWTVDLEGDGDRQRFSLAAGLLSDPENPQSTLNPFRKDVDRAASRWVQHNVDLMMEQARQVFRAALAQESVLRYLMDEKTADALAAELIQRSKYMLSFSVNERTGALIPGNILLARYDDRQPGQLTYLREVLRQLAAASNRGDTLNQDDPMHTFESCADPFRLTLISTAELVPLEGIDAYGNCEQKYWEIPYDTRQKNHIFPAEVRAAEYEEQLGSLEQRKRLLADRVCLLLENETRFIDFLFLLTFGMIVQREVRQRQITYYWALVAPSPDPRRQGQTEEWRLSDDSASAPSLMEAAISYIIIRADRQNPNRKIDDRLDVHVLNALKTAQDQYTADRLGRDELAVQDAQLRGWLENFMPPAQEVNGQMVEDLSRWTAEDDEQFLEVARLVVTHDMLQETVDEFKQYVGDLGINAERAEKEARDGATHNEALKQRELYDLYSLAIIALEKEVFKYRDLVRQRYLVKTGGKKSRI